MSFDLNENTNHDETPIDDDDVEDDDHVGIGKVKVQFIEMTVNSHMFDWKGHNRLDIKLLTSICCRKQNVT